MTNINNIQVSVLMPNYNSERFIGEAIESVLKQSYQNFELIILDDASADNSWEIIEFYSKKDKRIKAFRNEKNLGTVKSRNVLLSKVSNESKYIAWLDSDDVSFPDRLEKQIFFLEKNKEVGFCGGFAELINKNGERIGFLKNKWEYDNENLKKLLVFNPFIQSSVMIRKSVTNIIGKYNENFLRAEDYDYWLRSVKELPASNLSETLVKYRLHTDQGKFLKSRESFWYSFLVRKKYIFKKDVFSIKAFVIMILYLGAAMMPARFMVFLYKYVFRKK